MRFLMIFSVVVGAAFFAACGGDDDDKTSTPTAARSVAATVTGTTTAAATVGGSPAGESPFVVGVRLKDYEVIPNPDSGPAGDYEFQISNTGPSTHEFVVVKTDLGADNLPTDSDGAVAEGKLEVIGEVEAVETGSPQRLTASLDPGHYVVFCNIVEQGGGGAVAHYVQGMRKDFTVE